ncbi:hypothetical protein ACK2FW_09185 [Clostridioides difficile]
MKIILNGKYGIANFNEGITLSEAIDGVAYKMDVSLVEPKQLQDIGIKKGDKIVLIDIAYESKKKKPYLMESYGKLEEVKRVRN